MTSDTGEARQANGSLTATFLLEVFCSAVFVVISSYVLSVILMGKADDISTLAEIENLFNFGCIFVGLFYIACERVCAWLDQRHLQDQEADQLSSSLSDPKGLAPHAGW